jgi:hypothetical protein
MNNLDVGSIARILGVLDDREAAKVASTPEDNPFHKASLIDVAGRQEIPALNMAAKAPDNPLAYDMEAARFAAAAEGKVDRSAKRMAQAKARAERKVEFDKIAEQPKRVDQARMDEAWLVVAPLVGIIHMIAKSKQRWANRLLGSMADDIPSLAVEKTAMVLAKSDKDLSVLREAAQQLGDKALRTGKIPDEDPSKDERKHIKEVRKARKWLMGLINNRVMGALVDSFTSERNLRWDNIDIIASVIASINGPGDDPMTDRFKADRAPAFLGTRFQSPGGIDANLLAMGIAAAITEHRLDPMVEFLLDDDHRRVDGHVAWSEFAQDIFMLSPDGDGEWMWDMVVKATEHLKHARRERGVAARTHVRNLFTWLPGLIIALVDSFDPAPIGYSARTGGGRKILASEFELFYKPESPGSDPLRERRLLLQPALQYADTRAAAAALAEHLNTLTTGDEIVRTYE